MGLTVVDAGIIIGVLDADDAHHTAAVRALSAAIGEDDRIAVPASAYAESLVGPARLGPSGRQAVDDSWPTWRRRSSRSRDRSLPAQPSSVPRTGSA